jgi:tetratricopeptide (TPR) repeat protein
MPGLLTRDMEAYRILPILAAVVPLVALGIASLITGTSRPLWILAVLVIPSFGLDLYHLTGPCRRVWDSSDYWVRSVKAIQSYRAYGTLKEWARTQGPGVLFQDFNPNNSDHTLSLAAYPFDVLSDRHRSFEEARWAAVLVNVHYRPFLDRTLGQGRAFGLSKDLSSPDGGRMLWVVPLTDSNRARFRKWYEADLALDLFRDSILQDIGYFWGKPSAETFKLLADAYPVFKDDPDLRSFFWEKMADFDFKSGRKEQAIGCLKMALSQGRPAAHLYYRLGVLYLIQGNGEMARACLKKATQLPMDLTRSREVLEQMGPAVRTKKMVEKVP